MGVNNKNDYSCSGSGFDFGDEGDGLGTGYAYGRGYAYGAGYGNSDYGYAYGDGSGYGCNGSGNGYYDGSGYGYGYDYQFKIPYTKAWTAYHYIKKGGRGKFIILSGKAIKINEKIYEKKIKMCKYGLHACLSPGDANHYHFNEKEYVLTKVKVWGDIIVGVDKLVATNRMIIEEILR